MLTVAPSIIGVDHGNPLADKGNQAPASVVLAAVRELRALVAEPACPRCGCVRSIVLHGVEQCALCGAVALVPA